MKPLLALLLLAMAAIATPGHAMAHAGHDHGAEAAPAAVRHVPSVEAIAGDFELVAVLRDDGLVIWLDDFATNAPITDAAIEVEGSGGAVTASLRPDGTYAATAPWLLQPGEHDLTFLVTAPAGADILLGTLVVPAAEAQAAPSAFLLAGLPADRGILTAAAAFVLGALLAALMSRGRGTAAAVAVLAIGLAGGGHAFAHAGHDHGAPTPATAAADSPRRLPDGSVHMPKAAQRLLAIRTQQAEPGEAVATVRLVGRVVADPNGGGHVQATQSGRIEPGENGLPYPGQWVEAGEVLAHVAPAVGAVERSGVQQQMAQVDKELTIAQSRVQRLRALKDAVPRRELEEAEATVAGLKRQRAALAPALNSREALVAPIAGVVTASNVVIGQVIDGRDQVLFEIVDPARLMVEAIVFDPREAAALQGASAVTADGTRLDLDFVGRSLALRQQAIPLLFRITAGAEGLSLGQPVHVFAESGARAAGMVLPRAAIVRDGASQPVVWEHVSPQRFVARPVRLQPIDGERVLVLGGMEPGARVVTDGAFLVNQVR